MRVRSSLLVVCFVALAVSIQAQAPQLQIDSAAVRDGRVTFKGKNFGTSVSATIAADSLPSVVPLTVITATDTEVVCDVAAFEPGTYLVHLTRDSGATVEGSAKATLLIQ